MASGQSNVPGASNLPKVTWTKLAADAFGQLRDRSRLQRHAAYKGAPQVAARALDAVGRAPTLAAREVVVDAVMGDAMKDAVTNVYMAGVGTIITPEQLEKMKAERAKELASARARAAASGRKIDFGGGSNGVKTLLDGQRCLDDVDYGDLGPVGRWDADQERYDFDERYDPPAAAESFYRRGYDSFCFHKDSTKGRRQARQDSLPETRRRNKRQRQLERRREDDSTFAVRVEAAPNAIAAREILRERFTPDMLDRPARQERGVPAGNPDDVEAALPREEEPAEAEEPADAGGVLGYLMTLVPFDFSGWGSQ